MHLWDPLVQPTLMMYGIELWAARDNSKGLLVISCIGISCDACWVGVDLGTPNMKVLAEVGRYQIVVKAIERL